MRDQPVISKLSNRVLIIVWWTGEQFNILLNSQRGISTGNSNSVNNSIFIPDPHKYLSALSLSRLRTKLALSGPQSHKASTLEGPVSFAFSTHTLWLILSNWRLLLLLLFLQTSVDSSAWAWMTCIFSTLVSLVHTPDMHQEAKNSQNAKGWMAK